MTIETTTDELTRGTVFAGRYEIIEELGAGGMGRVYRAYDKKIEEEVALKLIRPEIAADKKTVERFRNEIKTARKIRHTHVCGMHDLHEEGKTLFITMEYVRGEDLKSVIRRMRVLAAGTAVSIARQVAEGLGEAHRLGVVHRDLKPSNVMIDKDGNAKIMDFGIARSLAREGTTAEGAVIGTPEYMSPEQVDGKPADVRADIYALGVILFEMITGRPPFDGETLLAIAHKHKYEPAPDPKALNPQIPADLSRLILCCLEKQRESRFQTTAELLADLEAVEASLPTTERTSTGRPSTRRKPTTSKKIAVEFTPKKFLFPAVATAALVIAVVLFRWHPWASPKIVAVPKVDHSIAVISFENLTGDPRHDSLIRAVPNLMITKFEAMGIPYVASWERLRDLLKQMGKDTDAPIEKETGFEVCRREGIAVLITGEVTKAGNVFVTNIKALDVGTKVSLASASSQGQGEESILLSQIDDLTSRIYQKLDWTLAKAGSASPVAEFTTTSMEAYNEFLKGRDLYDRQFYEDARQALVKAIDLDPGFASAHLYLAHAYGGLRAVTLQAESFEKAKALSDRATEKERLFIEASYASGVEKNPERKFRILQELTGKYPKEKRAYENLGRYYLEKRMFPEAIGEIGKALELDPDYALAVNLLAYTYLEMGEFEKAAGYFRRYAELAPGDPNSYDSLGELAFRMGKLDEAIANYREALKIKPEFGAHEWIAYIHAVKGDFREAVRSIDEYIRNARSKGIEGRGLMWRAYYHHVMGRRDLAMKEADQCIETWKSVNPYGVSAIELLEAWYCYDRGEYEKGRRLMQEYFDFNKNYDPPAIRSNTTLLELYLALLDVRQGRIESAKQWLEKAAPLLAQTQSELGGRDIRGLQSTGIAWAEIGLAGGKTEEVIAFMEKEFSLTSPEMNPLHLMMHNMPFEQDVLARAYRKAGNLDKAIEVYRKLLTFDPASQDRRIRIPVYHYRLGRLYEDKGLQDKAAEQYRVFLDLWKDADPGLPEVEDAKKRLAAII
jgi:serine/threonine protein kinase/tetratricopeptide (TPR) repeat protein